MKFLPDLICVWPIHLDFPLWRKFIHENRDKFRKVCVVFTQMNVPSLDYRQYIYRQMAKDKIGFIDSDEVNAAQDWRNVAVNKALQYCDGEWIFFTEQDFLPLEGFWEETEDLSRRTDVFGRFQEDRLHPCCLFIKRELLDKTSKDFGVIRDEADHFSRIQRDLEKKDTIIGVVFNKYGFHMNGLSQNMRMLQLGEKPNYQPEEFKEYCRKCLELPNHPDFEKLFSNYLGGENNA